MQVQVHILPEARNELVHLLAAHTPGSRADDVARMADVYLTDIETLLIRDRGKPYPLFRVRDVDGKVYWWQYCKGVWIVFTILDRGGRYFGQANRRITISRFRQEGPGR